MVKKLVNETKGPRAIAVSLTAFLEVPQAFVLLEEQEVRDLLDLNKINLVKREVLTLA